ncbi:MAG: hypothetical protein DBP02_02200 [gamma proteobacterium symbiont of Ctena orbiculata]|nr:MAG: hypothetical protein DBP02_02200 [gamma proteobacterium symbiont of Ctena orbiculata]
MCIAQGNAGIATKGNAGIATKGNAGIATSVGGTLLQAYAQNRSGRMNAAIQRSNAQSYEDQVTQARAAGRSEEQRQRISTKRALGTARASIAANGFDVGSGSALDRVGDIAKFGELDALTIRYNTELQARGHQADADQARLLADLEEDTGNLNAAATLLSGATSVHDRWYKLNKE